MNEPITKGQLAIVGIVLIIAGIVATDGRTALLLTGALLITISTCPFFNHKPN